MTHNPILEELYAARAKLLADADGDIHKYLEGVRQRERESGRPLTSTTQRANGCTGATDIAVSSGELLPTTR